MGRDYPRLEIEPFGRQLLRTGDLDPVYVALHQLQRDGAMLSPARNRWLLSYWCFYHVGQACYMADINRPGLFWEAMLACASNVAPAPTGQRWQRGHERRHFRGVQGIKAVVELQNRYEKDPGLVVAEIMAAGHTYREVSDAASKLRGFGPWISFKVADMIDRCTNHRVEFTPEQVFDMFEAPREAAFTLWRQKMGLPSGAQPKDAPGTLREVYRYLENQFSDHRAPPKQDRPVGIQEIETILCKWQSHLNGHYPTDNDINEINGGLAPWQALSPMAQLFRESMPLAEVPA